VWDEVTLKMEAVGFAETLADGVILQKTVKSSKTVNIWHCKWENLEHTLTYYKW